MEAAASEHGTARDEISHTLIRMKSLIGRLVASGFVTDRASGKFDQAYSEYSTHASGVIDGLSDIQLFLSQAAASMRDTDNQIAARIG